MSTNGPEKESEKESCRPKFEEDTFEDIKRTKPSADQKVIVGKIMAFTERPVEAVREIVDEDGLEREEFLKMFRDTVELWHTTANLRAGERGATVLQ